MSKQSRVIVPCGTSMGRGISSFWYEYGQSVGGMWWVGNTYPRLLSEPLVAFHHAAVFF